MDYQEILNGKNEIFPMNLKMRSDQIKLEAEAIF